MGRVGDGAAISPCNFAESGSPRRDHLRRRNRMWADRSFGQICPSSRKLPPSFGQPQLNGGTRMFEKFTRHLSGKENDGTKTGESFKIATPGSSLDHAPTRPDRLGVEAAGNHKVSGQHNYDTL